MSTATSLDGCRHPGLYLTPPAAQRDIDCIITIPAPITLDFITLDKPIQVRARLTGPEHAPVVLALGGISASRNVCSQHGGWWQDFAGPGLPLDSNTYRVLSFDFLSGPESSEPLKITPRDQARIAKKVCEHFGIQSLHAFAGASYGGMIALCFGQLFPGFARHLIVLCAAHRPHPMGAAWRNVQRKIVRLGLDAGEPDRALSLARELGMTTYRTAEEFGRRFDNYEEVASYLHSRGQDFIGKMSPERYLTLSESIDLHAVDPAQISDPVSLIVCRQDQLVPIEEARQLRDGLPRLFTYLEFDSIYGHDAFLKEVETVSNVLAHALQQEF